MDMMGEESRSVCGVRWFIGKLERNKGILIGFGISADTHGK